MKFFIYETTNKLNGKKYRGAHCCSHGDACCYLGSGTLLKKALAKYGPENFERCILTECHSAEEMFKAEAQYVTPDWVADLSTYNLKIGGEGGWDYINKTGLRWSEEKRKLHSIEMKKKRAIGEFGPHAPTHGFLGKSHSADTKRKISENSKMTLSKEVLAARSQQMKEVNYPKRGSVKRLAESWGISHTQVARFIRLHLS